MCCIVLILTVYVKTGCQASGDHLKRVLPLRVLNLGTRDPKDALAMAVDEPNFDILDAYIRADVDRKIMEQNRDLVFDLVENFNSESEVTNKYTEVVDRTFLLCESRYKSPYLSDLTGDLYHQISLYGSQKRCNEDFCLGFKDVLTTRSKSCNDDRYFVHLPQSAQCVNFVGTKSNVTLHQFCRCGFNAFISRTMIHQVVYLIKEHHDRPGVFYYIRGRNSPPGFKHDRFLRVRSVDVEKPITTIKESNCESGVFLVVPRH
ncbi:hypothetical protein M8J77_008373 [Diaphorina citri]|nr:hypothetical protein M8J77_008373 [Diaphorina citri]